MSGPKSTSAPLKPGVKGILAFLTAMPEASTSLPSPLTIFPLIFAVPLAYAANGSPPLTLASPTSLVFGTDLERLTKAPEIDAVPLGAAGSIVPELGVV
jgi:hypothetical protein